jgi:hypothetical protein
MEKSVARVPGGVIWFPGGDVFLLRSSESFASEYLFDFIPRGGRVLVYPIYKGMMPYDLSQQPFFAMLGAPADKKRLARLTGGHVPTNRLEIMREVVDWLDRQLGPVHRGSSVARATPAR